MRKVQGLVASFLGLKRRKKAWIQSFAHALNCGEIPLPPHTIDILPYTCDTNTDAKLSELLQQHKGLAVHNHYIALPFTPFCETMF